jgi:uncharacterized repeat protein (TIGR01451 family)
VFGPAVLAAALTVLAGSLSAQTITSLAGAGPDTGNALQRCIGWPYQVAIDALGNRYIATGPMHMVVKVDGTGVLSVVAGTGADDSNGDGGPATSASLRNPTGVALDTAGNIYISDSMANVIRKVTTGGIISTYAGNGFAGYGGDPGPATSASLNAPAQLSWGSGFLYVADAGNHVIRRIDTTANTIAFVAGGPNTPAFADGPAASARFNNPNGVAVSGGGQVYVADTNNNRVRLITGGVVSTVAGNGTVPATYNGDGSPATSFNVNAPEGVFVTTTGDVYIAEEQNYRIRKLTGTTISTVVGGTSGFGGDGGPPLSAAINRPYSMAVDAAGAIHMADTFNSRLRVIAASVINTVAGNGTIHYSGDGGTGINASFRGQRQLALDPSGSNLYIADEGNQRVRKMNLGTGIVTTVAGTGVLGYNGDGIGATTAYLRQPYGMAVDGSGNLYIADTYNNRVRKVDTAGNISTIAGTGAATFDGDGPATSHSLNAPQAVAVDSVGNVYVSDTSNNRIRQITTAGNLITVAGTGAFGYNGDGTPATNFRVYNPQGIAVDATGNVYIADAANARIRKLDTTGAISTVAGSASGGFSGDGGPATSARLASPSGVAVDSVGNIIIADTNNHRVRIVDKRTGNIISVSGSAPPGFSGDGGPAVAAKLDMPWGVVVNSAGKVIVSDQVNNRVRTFTLGTDLTITKDDAQTTAVPGTSVTYTVRVTNNGPNAVANVNVVDTFPPTLVLPSFTPFVGTYAPASGDWSNVNLAPGQSANMTVTATIASSATGTVTNTVKVSPPLGLTDPTPANDQASDTDTLTPQSDLSILVSASPSPATVGAPLVYTLNVSNAGPSDGAAVSVSDTLPSGVTFQSASAPCTYLAGTVNCSLGTIAAGSSYPAITIMVVPTATGTIVNSASVTFPGTDPNPGNNTSSATTVVNAAGPDTARYVTVTSKDSLTTLEWLNPVGYGNVRINYKSGATSCSFPTDPTGADGSTILVPLLSGSPDQPNRFDHTTLTDGSHYCYTIWVDKGGTYSTGKSIEGRPFVVNVGPGVKWTYSMGIFSMVPPGNGVGAVYAVANDGSLHSMAKGGGTQGGTWPAPPGFTQTWKPQSTNLPSQGRPSGIPTSAGSASRTIFLSSQDGHVYAFNAETGAAAWSPSSPLLGPQIVSHPAGVFTAFGGTRDLIFAGTRDSAGSQFYALRVADGSFAAPGWSFNGGAFGKIGAISGQAAVDQVARRVYFASRAFDGTNLNTVWCLDLETGAPLWAVARGDIDTGVSLYNGRLFVGTTGASPQVLAINTTAGFEGNVVWSQPIPPAEGPVKGYVAVDRLTGNSYVSTATSVRAFDPFGTPRWTSSSVTSPSTPVYAPGDQFLYVGSSDGKVYRLDTTSGGLFAGPTFPLLLGDGSAAAGSPTLDLAGGFLYVGAENGIVYAVQLP